MKQRAISALGKVIPSVAALAVMALSGIYIYPISTAVYCLAIAALALVTVILCAADEASHPHIARTALVATVIVSAAVGLYMLFYATGLNEKFTDFDALKSFILSGGYWGFAVFIGLTVFQVVVLPVPAAVIILLGVAIYGPTASFILTVIGTLIGSVISFTLGKVFGRRLCNWMFGAQNTDKYARLLSERGRFLFMIMLLFPAFPDDMLCMIAGMTDMGYGYFLIVCALTRPVMIGVTAYLGSGMIPFSGWGIPVWIAIVGALVSSFIVITCLKSRLDYRRADRRAKKREKVR